MKYAQMVCATSDNIGDDIQAIATASLLPRVDLLVDRERLNTVSGPDHVCMIMNGWFLQSHNWPPSRYLHPLFVGFHVAPSRRELIAAHTDYLRPFQPIGTRDKATAEFLQSCGLEAEVTYCLSLTFPPRKKAPVNGKVIIVDASHLAIPRVLRRNAMRIAHIMNGLQDTTKIQCAKDLIELYRDTASLIITTRLHCALPCIAMGIPVVFFGDPSDCRTSLVRDIGGTIYDRRLHRRGLVGETIGRALGSVDWSPKPLDVSVIKAGLRRAVTKRLEAMGMSARASLEPT